MPTIYCSQKLKTFLGKIVTTGDLHPEPYLGDWNGHSFTVNGKRCLLFMNSVTCYTVLMTSVMKEQVRDFGRYFRERLILQFNHDFQLNESTEVNVRAALRDLHVRPTNNNRTINGTMNQAIAAVPFYTDNFGPVDQWDDVKMTQLLNLSPTKAKVRGNTAKPRYIHPSEEMLKLIDDLR